MCVRARVRGCMCVPVHVRACACMRVCFLFKTNKLESNDVYLYKYTSTYICMLACEYVCRCKRSNVCTCTFVQIHIIILKVIT